MSLLGSLSRPEVAVKKHVQETISGSSSTAAAAVDVLTGSVGCHAK